MVTGDATAMGFRQDYAISSSLSDCALLMIDCTTRLIRAVALARTPGVMAARGSSATMRSLVMRFSWHCICKMGQVVRGI